MKRILYLVTQSELGGAQRYIFDLANNLKNKNYQVAVAAGGNQELFNALKEKNIEIYKVKNLVRQINPLKDLMAYFEIKKIIKKFNPDILHLNSSKAGVLGAIAGKKAKVKKIIYTVHGFVFNEPMPGWKKTIYLWAEKFSAHYKDKLICVSEFDRQVGLKNEIAKTDKLITIHNGINQLSFHNRKESREQLGLKKPDLVIGTLANFYPTKGLSYLIESTAKVNEEMPATFIIIGDGEQRQVLEEKIKALNLEKKFLLLGRKNKAWRYLKAFDIYVCSSIKEGFPYSILEAMQAGLPIVATKAGGIPEMINDRQNGLLVEPADSKALADSIIKLIKNKNLAEQLASQAQITALEKFNFQNSLAETEKVYN